MGDKKTEKLSAQLKSIQQISIVLGSTLNQNELLSLIIREIASLMEADRATLYLVDEEKDDIYSQVKTGNEVKQIRQKIGFGLSGWTAKNGKLVNIPDAYADTRFDPKTDKQSGYKTKSVLTAPIFEPPASGNTTKKVIAVAQVLNKIGENPFDSDDESLLTSLCAQTAIALHNSSLFAQVNEKVRESNFLFNVEKSVSLADDLKGILHDLITELCDFLYADLGMILLLNNQGQLRSTSTKGFKKDFFKNFTLDRKGGFAGWILENKKPLILEKASEDPRCLRELMARQNIVLESVIGVPITLEDNTIGVIEVFNQNQFNRFLSKDLKFLQLVSDYITHIIEIFDSREQKRQEDNLSTIGKLISSVAHDLRAPIANIKGLIDILKSDQISPEKKKEFSGLIDHQLSYMLSMTNEILDFSKGKASILPRKTGVVDLIAEFKKFLPKDGARCDVKLVINNRVKKELLYIDKEKMCRVFLNIYKNSIESYQGGSAYFELSIKSVENKICFELTDKGPGIPTPIKGSLFDSFTTHGKKTGTGLGLAIAKKIVEEHGGTIHFESSSNGTTFFIFLNSYKSGLEGLSK